jgi:predicted nucleotidyltransferase
MRLENFLSERLGNKVDLVTPDSLKPVIRQDVLSEVIYV